MSVIRIVSTNKQVLPYIAGNFHWCKFSYEQPIFEYFVFYSPDSDVESTAVE